jgi:hypothetical protein
MTDTAQRLVSPISAISLTSRGLRFCVPSRIPGQGPPNVIGFLEVTSLVATHVTFIGSRIDQFTFG